MVFEYDCFLSYNSSDSAQARALADDLRKRGIDKVWFDETHLPPGSVQVAEMEQGLRVSRSFVVLVGNNGLGPWQQTEVASAITLWHNRKQPEIIPVLHDGVKSTHLPPLLQTYTCLDMCSGTDARGRSPLDRLADAIKDHRHDYPEAATHLARRLVSTLDHGTQIQKIRAKLKQNNLIAALCVACSAQNTEHLAEHLFIALQSDLGTPLCGSQDGLFHVDLRVQERWGDKPEFERLLNNRLGVNGLYAAAPTLRESHSHHCVLCVTFDAELQGRLSLPERLADACSVLEELHAHVPELRLVVLFVCLVGDARPWWLSWLRCDPKPWWHHLLRKRLRRKLERCLWTDPPERLTLTHIETWEKPPLREIEDHTHHQSLRNELRRIWQEHGGERGRPSYMDLERSLAEAIARKHP